MRSFLPATSLRRRGLSLLVVTGGAAMLLGVRAPAFVAAQTSQDPSASPAPDASGMPSVSACVPVASPVPDASASPLLGADPAASAAPCLAPEPSPAPSPSAIAQVVLTGQPVDTQFGTIQVQILVQGSQILDVQPLQLPTDRARSAYISQVVAPMLHDEVMQAQSASINVISGATYTTQAYAMSLQSALDQRAA